MRHSYRNKANSRFAKDKRHYVSNCCNAEMKVDGTRTKWYTCNNCGRPCNPKLGRTKK